MPTTAYRGEDLFYDKQAPDRFVARCTRDIGAAAGACIYDRMVGSANITVAVLRAWIEEWRAVLTAIDSIVDRMQPSSH